MSNRRPPRLVAVDLFCGAGGLTHGLRTSGINVVAGVDIDPLCAFALEHNNPGARFVRQDVATLTGPALTALFGSGATIRVLAGCAPCQPFSRYSLTKEADNRWQLLDHFLRLTRTVRPDVVTMENVAELSRGRHCSYTRFLAGLSALGYEITSEVVACPEFGVPQTRERLVVLARLGGPKITLLRPRQLRVPTVRRAIGKLPRIAAGASARGGDRLHIAPALSEINRKRIQATSEGGSWREWSEDLRLDCHKKASGKYYGSVYGRMAWDAPGPTITTQCFGYGNGRFGHPSQDRAISLREAALLQTFPRDYEFVSPSDRVTFKNVGRLVGNAVPVALAELIGKSIIDSFVRTPYSQRTRRIVQQSTSDT